MAISPLQQLELIEPVERTGARTGKGIGADRDKTLEQNLPHAKTEPVLFQYSTRFNCMRQTAIPQEYP